VMPEIDRRTLGVDSIKGAASIARSPGNLWQSPRLAKYSTTRGRYRIRRRTSRAFSPLSRSCCALSPDNGAGCGGLAIGAMSLKEPNASGSVRHLPHLPGAGSWRAGQMRIGVAHNNRATPRRLSTVLPR
jgi:hypothetical protein